MTHDHPLLSYPLEQRERPWHGAIYQSMHVISLIYCYSHCVKKPSHIEAEGPVG